MTNSYHRTFRFCWLILLFLLISLGAHSGHAKTLLVINTQDQGNGSLAWAIDQSNTNAGPDTIEFAIPKSDPGFVDRKGIWQLNIQTVLPVITDDGTYIDGTSQAKNIENANADGLEILIHGIQVPVDEAGIEIQSAFNKITGISIGGFRGPTIRLYGHNAHNNIIQNCYIGIDEDGKFGFNVKKSLGIQFVEGTHHNVIGGVGESLRNIISGHYYEAIEMKSSHHNTIIGNYIGVTRSGMEPLGNGWGENTRYDNTAPLSSRYQGVYITEGSYSNRIGGAEPGEGNVICGSGRPAIRIEAVGSDSNVVKGNFLGVAADGETPIPNYEAGLWIAHDPNLTGGPAYNIIGGLEPGAGNVISGNHSSGVQFRRSSHHNIVQGNRIGTDVTGTKLVPNSHNGIYLYGNPDAGFPQYNTIGPGNIIVANGDEKENAIFSETWGAVRLDNAGTAHNRIYGNYLGTNPEGTLSSAYNSGVVIGGEAHDNVIGPDNVIMNNKKYGVWIRQDNSIRNKITKNIIYGNGILPIYLQDGGNMMIEQPTILSANNTSVSGLTVPFGQVELFKGKGEATEYVATVIADAAGNFTWNGSTGAPFVTATVTDADSNTSMLATSVAVPVELSSFSARFTEDGLVQLTWITESETNNLGFYVERESGDKGFESVDFVPGKGTTTNRNEYEFTDKSFRGATATYRLKQTDFDGSFHYSPETSVSKGTPATYKLYQAYPNPFNASTSIRFDLPQSGHISLAILNIQGETTRTLADGAFEAGSHIVSWDGLNDDGEALASGQYFVRLVSREKVFQTKIVLVK
jgi:hypothetical protein